MKKIAAVLFTFWLSLGSSAFTGAVPRQANPQSLSKGETERLKKPTKYSAEPVKGEFDDQSKSAELVPDQDRRVVRESRYKGTHKEIVDPGDSTEDYVVTINDYFEPPDPFPVTHSAAIVVGTVLSGKAFVSKDRTFVYSDYQVRVDRVLKQDASSNIADGDQIVVLRSGGAIHFPSGHVRNYIDGKRGYPALGSQYLFFLGKPDFPEHEYEQAVGALYLLSDGKVHPMDIEQLDKFDGMSEAAFMSKVEQAIAQSQKGAKP